MGNRKHLKKLIENNTRRLHKLQEQQAIFGINTDPSILIEIENIEDEIEDLKKKLVESENTEIVSGDELYFFIEPHIVTASPRAWVIQDLFLTNISAEIFRHVELTIEAPWQVNLKQKKFAIDNLLPDESQKVKLNLKVDSENTSDGYQLKVRLRADKHPFQITTLKIATIKAINTPETPLIPSSLQLPSIRDFRIELRKLTDIQFIELGDEDTFADLSSILEDTLLTSERKVNKIVALCKYRGKFPELHQALNKILRNDYRFRHNN